MKKFLAMIMGVLLLVLVACANEDTKEASGEETSNGDETEETEQESEVDMDTLIDQVSMDATVDSSSDQVTFDLSLANEGEEPLILGFTSSQKYEIKVTDDQGESVYTYSADKMFAQELTTVDLAAGDELDESEVWTDVAKPGEYEATVTFLVSTINDQPLEANPFELTQSFTIEKDASEKEDGTTTSSTDDQSSGETNQAFRHLEVKGENGTYVVKGEARVFEGKFMYSVEDGHNVLVDPTSVQVNEGAPSWSTFEIEVNIPEKDLPDYGTLTMVIFEKSAKDGKPENVNYLPLDEFNPEG